MKLACNIKRMGRIFRIATGAVLLFNGIGMYWLNVPGPGLGWRIVQAVVVLAGAFAVFEGVVGWCAVRAMGYKTRF